MHLFRTLARGEVAPKLDFLVIFSFKIIDIFKAEVESFKMYQVISRRKKKLKKCHKQQIERLLLISYLMKSPPLLGEVISKPTGSSLIPTTVIE